MATEKPKNPLLTIKNTIYDCSFCDFHSVNKKDFERHIKTKKHLKWLTILSTEKTHDDIIEYTCNNCNKKYNDKSGLWKHKTKCTRRDNLATSNETDISSNTNIIPVDLVYELIKQNKELQNFLLSQNTAHQKQILELSNKQSSIITTNSHNTTNNQFNLNFFLNETCKDAMNITDFVNSLKLDTSDFVTTGRLGYVEGISRIIINGLKDIDVEKRPMHCTDLKRETVYIKHDNTWEKEEPDKKKLKWAVNSVARLNLKQLDIWQDENPEYKISDSTKNYEYLKYCSAALGGQYKEQDDKFAEKIMRNVLREVVVNKHR
jgi:hypothetical protein